MTLEPWSATTSIKAWRNSRRASGSRLATGSSSTSRAGHLATAMVSASCARWPPDSLPALWCGSRPSWAIRVSAVSWSQLGFVRAPKRRWSRIDRPAYVGVSWATKPTRASCSDVVPGLPPQTVSDPVSARRSPTASWSSVLLPAPLGPTSPTALPAGTESVHSDSAYLCP